MKAIYYAMISPTTTEGEYQVGEHCVAEYGLGWNGNVYGYLDNMLDDPEIISSTYDGAIYDIPDGEDYHYLIYDGKPFQMFWAAIPEKFSDFEFVDDEADLLEQLRKELTN